MNKILKTNNEMILNIDSIVFEHYKTGIIVKCHLSTSEIIEIPVEEITHIFA